MMVCFKPSNINLVLGFVTAIVLLYLFLPGDNRVQFEDLALGEETHSIYVSVNNRKIHCNDMINSKECVDSYYGLGSEQPVILWLGNSQVHAINQPKINAETAATKLHRKLQLEGKYFLTYSQPNANLQEHLILFSDLITKVPITTLVLPIVFDDLREDGIRNSLLPVFDNPEAVQLIKQSDIGVEIYEGLVTEKHTKNELAGLDDSVQEKVELVLNERLKDSWVIWDERSSFRGQFLNFLYVSRNWIFGINPSSTRKMIPGRYSRNMEAFLEILEMAKKNEITVFVYVVPLRNDAKIPYQPKSYSQFKLKIEGETIQKGFYFSNFENVVPNNFWGYKGSTSLNDDPEIDFMHFQEKGHELLANAIYEKLLDITVKQ